MSLCSAAHRKSRRPALAKRGGQWCSNPDCLNKTSGPHSNQEKSVNLGEAAHIKGGKPTSARYDPNMTDEERSQISNGIWLCTGCAKKIDKDPERFPVKLLHIWKEQHERWIQTSGSKTSTDSRVQEELHQVQKENTELRRENEQLRQQLKEMDDWENTKKQYDRITTSGGATVYQYIGDPVHYACPSCFTQKTIQFLQVKRSVSGVFQCPNCNAFYLIKPETFASPSVSHEPSKWRI